MSKVEMSSHLLSRAALLSYVMGALVLVLDVALFAWVFTVALPYSSASAQLSLETFVTILWVVLILLPITILVSAFFGYYSRKVGDTYNASSLKLAGLMAILLAVVAIPVAVGIYGFVAILQAFASPPGSIIMVFIQLIVGIGLALAFLALFVLLALVLLVVLGLVFEVSLFTGLSSMYEVTGIGEFKTAKWLVLAGIFVLIPLPIGILFYARGLSKLSRGEKTGKGSGKST
ncbi:MAG: hypothetical protein WED04_13175 [Promethearchaeati archaeon SRVP18_Atabeyarchaeia-1]